MAGCASNVVILSTATRTGVEINATEAAQQGAHVGIERFEGVIMPIVATNKTGETIYLAEAYPIYSRYYFHSGGLVAKLSGKDDRGLILKQSFATGQAATMDDVRAKVNSDYIELMSNVKDVEAFQQTLKLTQLLEKMANTNFTLESQILRTIQANLSPSAAVTNLDQAHDLVRNAGLAGNKEAIIRILKDLNLYP